MSLKETMAELQVAAKELNEASDQLNELISEFEDQLASYGVGVEAWLREPVDRYKMGYAKVGEMWCVVLENRERIKLSSAPRHVRIAAVGRFEELAQLLTSKLRVLMFQAKAETGKEK